MTPWREMFCTFVKMFTPTCATSFITLMINSAMVAMFLGHVSTAAQIAGAGQGMSVINFMQLSFVIGLNQSLAGFIA